MSANGQNMQTMPVRAVLPATNTVTAEPAPHAPPVVFIDGVMRTDWIVDSVRMEGPLDRRRTDVRRVEGMDGVIGGVAVNRDPPGGTVAIAQPIELAGGVMRWMPLVSGRFAQHGHRVGDGEQARSLVVTDDWNALLDRALNGPIVAADVQAALLAWRRRAQVSAEAMNHDTLSAVVRRRALPNGQLTGRTFGAALQTLLSEHGLRARQHLTWQGGQARRTVMIESVARGQPVRFAVDPIGQPAVNLAAIDRREVAHRPVRWIAEAAPRRVESTFALHPAWPTNEMALPDAEYARATSGDFESVAHVFRLWVLNEDGAFTGGQINLGEPFDLAALFDDGRAIAPQPVRFGPALTRDPAGRSVGVVVEHSTDGGATWQRMTGAVRVLTDRAGIVLDDDALPAEWLTANRDGTARLRVTATLRHPEPTRAIRWAGNPFTGPFDTRRISVGETFGWRAVLPGSRFHDAVLSGTRQADETDDRAALDQWLAERVAMAQGDHEGDPAPRDVGLTHTGLQLGLRTGDRMTHLAGRYFEPAVQPRLSGIVHDFTRRRTRTEWRSP